MQALCLEECHRVIHYRDFDEVFTLIEEFATRIEDKQPTFQKEVNAALTRNQAPYVLYKSPAKGWMIIQTGAEIQRDTVLKCLSDLRDPSFEKTRGHFEKAGGHLAKGESPEAAGQSAKAFEACLRKLVNKPDLSGGQALELYTKIFLLPLPMKEAIHGIWNYRNKTEDVGHSGKEGSQSLPPGKLDAQFIYAATASCIIHLINWSRDQRSS